MFGSLMNIISIPARVAFAPIKAANRVLDTNGSIEKAIVESVEDTTRYVLTGKEKYNDMDGLLDFDKD
jgi:hypothetical protein